MEGGRVGPLPAPWLGLAGTRLPLIERGGPWFRTHSLNRSPYYFGRAIRYRFDDLLGEFGVLYAAADRHGAFIETFGQLAIRPDRLPRPVSSQELARKALSEFRSEKPLRLVDLTGPGLARLGADARLFAGEHGPARDWSRALRCHPEKVDGIYYPVRHDPSRVAIAVFNEATVWTDLSRQTWISLGATLRDILDHYGFALIDGHQRRLRCPRGPNKRRCSSGGLSACPN